MINDMMQFVNILIIIESILLFVLGFLGGKSGLVITIVLTNIATAWFYIYCKAMGAAFSNSQMKNPGVGVELFIYLILITLICTYLAWGINSLILSIKTGSAILSSFYIWLVTVGATLITFAILRYTNDPIRVMEKKISKDVAKHRNEQHAIQQEEENERNRYNSEVSSLQVQFENAMNSSSEIKNYIAQSEEISQRFKNRHELPMYLANFTTKLLINAIKKDDLSSAQILFNSYVDTVIPHSGISEKSSDVAGNAIILAIKLNSDSLFDKIEMQIIGKETPINEITNEILLFNLACYYALKENSDKLYPTVKQALLCGKSPKSFLEDSDFERYHTNEEFLSILSLKTNAE